MKKKQKQKLLQQFRPSYEQARLQLFKALEQKAKELFDLDITIYIDPKKLQDMTIENAAATTREKLLTVPMDENFIAVVKRLQKQEKGLLERFSTNLTEEIANYWSAKPVSLSESAKPETPAEAEMPSAEAAVEAEVALETETAPTATEPLNYASFTAKIGEFPNFFVEKDDTAVYVKEKAKEVRLLATISQKVANEFTIEKALERKYKLKIDVIPVIESFAATPLAER